MWEWKEAGTPKPQKYWSSLHGRKQTLRAEKTDKTKITQGLTGPGAAFLSPGISQCSNIVTGRVPRILCIIFVSSPVEFPPHRTTLSFSLKCRNYPLYFAISINKTILSCAYIDSLHCNPGGMKIFIHQLHIVIPWSGLGSSFSKAMQGTPVWKNIWEFQKLEEFRKIAPLRIDIF